MCEYIHIYTHHAYTYTHTHALTPPLTYVHALLKGINCVIKKQRGNLELLFIIYFGFLKLH